MLLVLHRGVSLVDQILNAVDADADKSVAGLAAPLVCAVRETRKVLDDRPLPCLLRSLQRLQRLHHELWVTTCLPLIVKTALNRGLERFRSSAFKRAARGQRHFRHPNITRARHSFTLLLFFYKQL